MMWRVIESGSPQAIQRFSPDVGALARSPGATPRSVPDSSCAAQPWAQLATREAGPR